MVYFRGHGSNDSLIFKAFSGVISVDLVYVTAAATTGACWCFLQEQSGQAGRPGACASACCPGQHGWGPRAGLGLAPRGQERSRGGVVPGAGGWAALQPLRGLLTSKAPTAARGPGAAPVLPRLCRLPPRPELHGPAVLGQRPAQDPAHPLPGGVSGDRVPLRGLPLAPARGPALLGRGGRLPRLA